MFTQISLHDKPIKPKGYHYVYGEPIRFGKYKGKTLDEISDIDRKYYLWLMKQDWFYVE